MTNRHTKQHDRSSQRVRGCGWVKAGLAICAALAVVVGHVGCASPPSVIPLLAVTEQALLSEAERIDQDSERDAMWLEQARQALERAYEADLAEQASIDAQWVRSATAGYVLAREALVRHELDLKQQRHDRSENLHAAAQAARRAIELLQQRDALVDQVAGQRLRRLLDGQGVR